MRKDDNAAKDAAIADQNAAVLFGMSLFHFMFSNIILGHLKNPANPTQLSGLEKNGLFAVM